MKTCQPCGAECADDAPHCSACGEASFAVSVPEAPPAPEQVPLPIDAPEEPAGDASEVMPGVPSAPRRRQRGAPS